MDDALRAYIEARTARLAATAPAWGLLPFGVGGRGWSAAPEAPAGILGRLEGGGASWDDPAVQERVQGYVEGMMPAGGLTKIINPVRAMSIWKKAMRPGAAGQSPEAAFKEIRHGRVGDRPITNHGIKQRVFRGGESGLVSPTYLSQDNFNRAFRNMMPFVDEAYPAGRPDFAKHLLDWFEGKAKVNNFELPPELLKYMRR